MHQSCQRDHGGCRRSLQNPGTRSAPATMMGGRKGRKRRVSRQRLGSRRDCGLERCRALDIRRSFLNYSARRAVRDRISHPAVTNYEEKSPDEKNIAALSLFSRSGAVRFRMQKGENANTDTAATDTGVTVTDTSATAMSGTISRTDTSATGTSGTTAPPRRSPQRARPERPGTVGST